MKIYGTLAKSPCFARAVYCAFDHTALPSTTGENGPATPLRPALPTAVVISASVFFRMQSTRCGPDPHRSACETRSHLAFLPFSAKPDVELPDSPMTALTIGSSRKAM